MNWSEKACPCPYCRRRREELEKAAKPGWLQRECDAARKSTAQPAADPWIKIEPGCQMPENTLCLIKRDDGLCVTAILDKSANEWRQTTGGVIHNDFVTHYAVVRMPEAE